MSRLDRRERDRRRNTRSDAERLGSGISVYPSLRKRSP
uniref:Uncharacterized protein n=1 Tax=uncultured Armatimonadetes bacterium TaxID=157466 RepID=A0A6J4I6R1_9BACT|nr:hypothetical protein AVDCRST_MAG63-2516 [uncultured Armatimonadetes bacterium]